MSPPPVTCIPPRADGRHLWRRRAPGSRYWDCVANGCGSFFLDLKNPPRARAGARLEVPGTGRCPLGHAVTDNAARARAELARKRTP
jgi:hypothetical protein